MGLLRLASKRVSEAGSVKASEALDLEQGKQRSATGEAEELRRGNGFAGRTPATLRMSGRRGSRSKARWRPGRLPRASKAAGRLETLDLRPGPEELDPGDDGASAGGHGISHSFPMKRQRG